MNPRRAPRDQHPIAINNGGCYDVDAICVVRQRTNKPRTDRLGTVFRIDGNVFMRQIRSPHRNGVSAPAKTYPHGYLIAIHDILTCFFGVSRVPHSVSHNTDIIEMYFDPFEVEVGQAGSSDTREDSPPVRIRGEERRHHERRMGDCVGDVLTFFIVMGAFDHDGDELGCPFPVSNDGLSELDTHIGQGIGELVVVGRHLLWNRSTFPTYR